MITVRTLEDVKRLIDNRVEEGLTLEYKRELSKNNKNNRGLAKEVCAFANSEGGTLIYGVDAEDKVPTGFSWIEGEGIEERIQAVVANSIHPKLEGVSVLACPNPADEKQAIFVVEVPKSPYAPHMSDHCYYKRDGPTSRPMDHDEIKNAMFGAGRSAALRFEISANLSLIDKTCTLLENVFRTLPQRRQRIALVPFHTDAWHAVVATGLLFAFSERTVKQLVEAYAITHEINSLIDWLKVEKEPTVHTSAYEDSFKEHGTYIPSIIQSKLGKLTTLLRQISNDLGQ